MTFMPEPSPYPTHTEPLRLAYRLTLRGQPQGALVEVSERRDQRLLAESDLKARLPQLHALDLAIVRELRSGTVFGQLNDSQLARLLPLLIQRRCTLNGERLRVGDAPLRPRLRVEVGRLGSLRLLLDFEDPDDGEVITLEKGRLVAGSQAFFIRGQVAHPVDAPNPWELTEWTREPVRDIARELTPAERDRMVRDLRKAGIPDDDLDQLAVRRTPPDSFLGSLWAEGSGKNLVACLRMEADYQGHRVALESQRPRSSYFVTENDNPDETEGVVQRDLAAEEECRILVRSLGFRFDKDRNAFVAKNEVALEALNPTRPFFPPEWRMERSGETPIFHRDLNVRTQVKLLEDQGLVDVAFDFDAIGDDATIEALVEMKDLLKWLQSGRHYLRLQDGSYVAPGQRFRRTLQLLDDLGAASKRALVSPLCVGLLRAIGDNGALATADRATQGWLDEVSGSSAPQPILLPTALSGVLREYQQRGLEWLAMLHRHRLTGILADDMGLGKTIQTLTLLLWLREREGPQPSLVVAPTSVVSVWEDEAVRFAPSMKVALYHGPPKIREEVDVAGSDLTITSYGVLRRDAPRLAEISFRYVILDEAQSAKNAASQNARAIRKLKSERRLALTGTPIENRPEELWAAFDFLAPGFLGNLSAFRKRYARAINREETGASDRLRSRIGPLVLRRLKKEVARELPDKVESIVRCDMNPAQRALYNHIAGELRENVQRKIEKVGIERAQLDVLAALTRLRQICCDPALLPHQDGIKVPASAKLDLFSELMREALESERRVVVFSQFVQMQKRIIECVRELGVEPLWLHGGTRNRKKVVDDFQDPNGPPVIVVSLRAGGTGVTLTRADTVMHYDPWWNPAVEQQATDRTHRLGQTQQVSVYKLVCAHTIEEKVLKLAARKDAMARELLGSEGGGGSKRITRDEVLSLLQVG